MTAGQFVRHITYLIFSRNSRFVVCSLPSFTHGNQLVSLYDQGLVLYLSSLYFLSSVSHSRSSGHLFQASSVYSTLRLAPWPISGISFLSVLTHTCSLI
jgi:hypothetical protein